MIIKNLLSILIFLISPVIDVNSQANDKTEIKCELERLDKCAKTLYVYGDRNFIYSKIRQEHIIHCRARKEAETCVKQYTQKCVHSFARQYINIVLKGPNKNLKESCASRKGISEHMKAVTCLNMTKQGIDDCNEQLINDMLRIGEAKRQDWIKLSCCFMDKLEKCSKIVIDSKCEGKQNDHVMKKIRNFKSESFDLLCDKELYVESEKCRTIISKYTTDEMPKSAQRFSSVIPVVLDLMTRFVAKE